MRRAGATGLFLLALLAAFHFGRDLLLPIALAVTFTLMLQPAVRLLRRWRIHESLGAGIVVLTVVGAFIAGSIFTYEPAMAWAERAPDTLRKAEGQLRRLQRRVENFGRAAAEVEKLASLNRESVPAVKIKSEDLQTTLARFTAETAASGAIVLTLLYFLLATRARLLHQALALLVQPTARESQGSIVAETEQHVSRYLFTIMAINLGLGAAIGVAMWAWGMPTPVLWGAMAAVVNFVPYLGAAAGICVTGLAAMVTFPDLRWVAVPLTYLAIASVEGMVVTPAILGRRFALDPVVVTVWLVFWGWLWGIGGALLAMPMLVMLRIVAERAPALGAILPLLANGDAPDRPIPAAVSET